MKSLRLFVVLATATTLFAAPGAFATDEFAEPVGNLCGFSSIADPTGEENVQTGEMDGGPLHSRTEAFPVASLYLVCTIQVGANSTHAGTDAFSAIGWGVGVVVLPPTLISYEATPDENVYLCSEFWVDTGKGHVSIYWDASNDPLVDGSWSTSPTANCSLAIATDTPGEDEFPFNVLNPVLDAVFDLLNATVCPILLAIDVRLGTPLAATWQDCESYSPII